MIDKKLHFEGGEVIKLNKLYLLQESMEEASDEPNKNSKHLKDDKPIR